MVLMAIAIGAKAADYDLIVCGTQVTSANAGNVLGDGAFSYNNSTKTLTVKGDCTYDETLVENKGIDGLTIKVVADVTFTGCNRYILNLSANTTITGSGQLKLLNSGGGIYVKGCKLTIDDADVVSEGKFYGSTGALLVRNSDVHVTTEDGAIYSFGNLITLERCSIVVPAGGRNTGDEIVDGSGDIAKEVVIRRDPVYDLYICGTQVKFANRNDILGDGAFSYNNSTKTLTVKGDLAYTGSEYVIDSQMSGLTINVAADSKLTSSKESVVHIGADATITGQGKLALESRQCAIYVERATLTITDMTLDAVGKWGIAGFPEDEYLVIERSELNVAGTVGAICDFLDITLDDECVIAKPQGGTIDGGKIVDAEGNTADEVTIERLEYYGLRVFGIPVTNGNFHDILAAFDGYFDSRTMVYDPDTKTLHVKGAVVDINLTEEITLINNESIDGLTISIDDDALLIANMGIETSKNTTITGNGLLLLQTLYELISVYDGAKLTLKNLALGFMTVFGGICGDEGGESLELDNVWLQGQTFYLSLGAICGFNGGITMKDCYFVTPEDAKVEDGWVVSDDQPLLVNLKIERGNPMGIDEVAARKFADMPRYNLQGMHVGKDYKGLIIEGGKKVLVK